jgi:Sigma-70, region 4
MQEGCRGLLRALERSTRVPVSEPRSAYLGSAIGWSCGVDLGLAGETQSLREIAGRLGVSAERFRKLENRALGKLRAAASGEADAT